jgi:hypothetical protein
VRSKQKTAMGNVAVCIEEEVTHIQRLESVADCVRLMHARAFFSFPTKAKYGLNKCMSKEQRDALRVEKAISTRVIVFQTAITFEMHGKCQKCTFNVVRSHLQSSLVACRVRTNKVDGRGLKMNNVFCASEQQQQKQQQQQRRHETRKKNFHLFINHNAICDGNEREKAAAAAASEKVELS